jgi:multidrug efflux pump subunit AcrA (membrane-fusion protein)
MTEKTFMTNEDLTKTGPKLADEILKLIEKERPAAAVAGAALALAAITVLAECGPIAAWKLFDAYFRCLSVGLAPNNKPPQLERLLPEPPPTGNLVADLLAAMGYIESAADRGFDLHDPHTRLLILKLARAERMRIEMTIAQRTQNATGSLASLRLYLKLGVLTEAEAIDIARRSGIDPAQLSANAAATVQEDERALADAKLDLERADAIHPIDLDPLAYSAREMRLMGERDAALTRAEKAEEPVERLANRRFDVPCPQCGAKPFEACRNKDGTVSATLHESRTLKIAITTQSSVTVERSADDAPGPAIIESGQLKPPDEERRKIGGHLPTCGHACTGEPMCSEVWDIVQGISADDRRHKYGVLAIDVVCPQCGSGPGSICMGMKHTIAHHTARGLAAQTQRNIDRGKAGV